MNKQTNGYVITRLKKKEVHRGFEPKNMQAVDDRNQERIKLKGNTSKNWPSGAKSIGDSSIEDMNYSIKIKNING